MKKKDWLRIEKVITNCGKTIHINQVVYNSFY